MTHFILADRKIDYFLPPSVGDWLNEDHLARFDVEVIDQLDLSRLTRQYVGRARRPTIRPPCWRFWFMATPPACSPAAAWSGPLTIRLPFAILRRGRIPITTPWRASAGAFTTNWRGCLYRCWNWPRK